MRSKNASSQLRLFVQPFSHFDRAYLAHPHDAGSELELDGDL